jgi:hypothetical protein
MKMMSLTLALFLLTSAAMAQAPATSEVSVVTNQIEPLNKAENLGEKPVKPEVLKGPQQYIHYPNGYQMSYQSFHKMIDSLGIVIATTDKEGNLCVVTPVTITTFPPRRGFILEVVVDDPRTKLELKPDHLGYQQSQQILACHDIKVTGLIYHLYPKRLECKMMSLCNSKYCRDTFWRPSLRCRKVIEVSYGFHQPCFLSNDWGIYVKSLTYH